MNYWLIIIPLFLSQIGISQVDAPKITMEILSAQLNTDELNMDQRQVLNFDVEFVNHSSDTVKMFRTARPHAYDNKYKFQTIGFDHYVFEVKLMENECPKEDLVVWKTEIATNEKEEVKNKPIKLNKVTGNEIEKNYLTKGQAYEEEILFPNSSKKISYVRNLAEPICRKAKLKLVYDTSPFSNPENFYQVERLYEFYTDQFQKILDKENEIAAEQEKNDYTEIAKSQLDNLRFYFDKTYDQFIQYHSAIRLITPLKMESNTIGITKK